MGGGEADDGDKEQQHHGFAGKGRSRRLKMVCTGGAQSGTPMEG